MGRKLRTALTALAVVLGVAMVSGTFVLTDTMRKAFDSLFEGSYEGTSAVISGKEVVKGAASGNATVPESLLPKVRELPGVEAASGAIFNVSGTTDLAKLIDRDGKQIGTGEQRIRCGDRSNGGALQPIELTQGDSAMGPIRW